MLCAGRATGNDGTMPDAPGWHSSSVECLVESSDGSKKGKLFLNLGESISAIMFKRVRPLAHFELRFRLPDGRKISVPSHKAILAQNAHVLR